MSYQHQDEILFDTVREIPVEMSQEQVAQIIAGLPLMAPPSAGTGITNLFKIHLNSILVGGVIMGGLFVGSGLLHQSSVANSYQPRNIDGSHFNRQTPFDEFPQILPLTIIDKEEDKIEQTVETAAADDSTTKKTAPKQAKQQEVLIRKASTKDKKTVTTVTTLSASILNDTPIAMVEKESILVPESAPLIEERDTFSTLFDEADEAPLVPTIFYDRACDSAHSFGHYKGVGHIKSCACCKTSFAMPRLIKFKRSLNKFLQQEKIVSKKTKNIRICYHRDGIWVNRRPLEGDQKEKLAQFFEENGIEAGPNREIQISKKYFAVGDFIGSDFYGSGHGTFVDFKTQEELRSIKGRYTSWK